MNTYRKTVIRSSDWIPVWERCPDKAGYYMAISVCFEMVHIGDAYYSYEEQFPEDAGWNENNNGGWTVLAWKENVAEVSEVTE